MREFLAHGRYCDWDSRSVRDTLPVIVDGAMADIDVATRLFRFVRDHILYFFAPWGTPASCTLSAKEGCCTNKSNLLVALLRAAGIPAAYGVLHVNPQEYFGNIGPPFLKPLVSSRSVHVYTMAFLQGRWVRCDPSTDRELSSKTAHFCRQTRLIEWDGLQDALDFLQPQHVYSDRGMHPSVDELLDKPPRHGHPATLIILNDYIRFIREQPPFPSAEALINAYWSRTTAAEGNA